MRKNKTPNNLLWLIFTVELLLVITSIAGYKLSERIPEETHPMSYYTERIRHK